MHWSRTLIYWRLWQCNAVTGMPSMMGLPFNMTWKLQLVQNATASILYTVWLLASSSFPSQVQLMVLVTADIYKALIQPGGTKGFEGLPCSTMFTAQWLQSSEEGLLQVPLEAEDQLVGTTPKAFSRTAPWLRNFALATSLRMFHRHLETKYFRRAFLCWWSFYSLLSFNCGCLHRVPTCITSKEMLLYERRYAHG